MAAWGSEFVERHDMSLGWISTELPRHRRGLLSIIKSGVLPSREKGTWVAYFLNNEE